MVNSPRKAFGSDDDSVSGFTVSERVVVSTGPENLDHNFSEEGFFV